MKYSKNIILVILLGLLGISGFCYSAYYVTVNIFLDYINHVVDIITVIILLAIALICTYYSVEMPQHGQLTVNGAIFFACMLLFGKEVAILVAFISVVVVSIISGANRRELVYRTGQSVVCIFLAGLVFFNIHKDSNTGFFLNSIWSILAIFLSALVYMMVDTVFSSLYVSTLEELNFRHVWEWHWLEIWPYYISILPVGACIAIFYRLSPVSSIFIILPLYLLQRIYNAIKLQGYISNMPAVVQSAADKEVEAVVVKTEQVRKEIEKKHRELEILLQTSQELGKSLKLEDTYEVIKKMIKQLVKCQTCIIFLVKEVEGESQLVAETVFGPYTEYVLTVKTFPISSKETIVGWVASEKKSHLIPDTESQTIPPPMIRYERSEMAVPLLSKDECIGVIYVGEQKSNTYTQDDLNLLSTLANQAAISVTNAQLYEKTHNMATTDGLTGLYTHRYFQEKIEEEIQKAQRYKTTMAMIMVDTDHFKEYNDSYGHPEGDQLLKEICKLLKSYVRDTDIVCRYGGDEFSLILVEADKKTAINTAERIRQAIQLRLNQREVKITASIGVASYPEDATNKIELIKKADSAVYEAKNGGRNKVCYPK
ncbi:MAG TPA: sensor domain-containing diguanylate cyclase [Candidatus Eremiobacteraeota bacterium]|nr:MAG: Phytochrome-like protein cph2 [bacterium ADurb.Bin363]HPZ08931.1 sensor domain-containing diguanylate cyclase [Candidatus Eremiobacteraeota bacterium]